MLQSLLLVAEQRQLALMPTHAAGHGRLYVERVDDTNNVVYGKVRQAVACQDVPTRMHQFSCPTGESLGREIQISRAPGYDTGSPAWLYRSGTVALLAASILCRSKQT